MLHGGRRGRREGSQMEDIFVGTCFTHLRRKGRAGAREEHKSKYWSAAYQWFFCDALQGREFNQSDEQELFLVTVILVSTGNMSENLQSQRSRRYGDREKREEALVITLLTWRSPTLSRL